MNQFQFDTELDRLRTAFNAGQFYNNERVKMIWMIVADLPDHAIKKMVNYFIETQRQPPTPQDFRKASYEYRTKVSPISDAKENTIYDLWGNCVTCSSIGYVAIKTEHDSRLALCTCEWGRTASWQELPYYDKVMKPEWSMKAMNTSWFKPKIVDEGYGPSVHDKVREFRNLIHQSLSAWGEQ